MRAQDAIDRLEKLKAEAKAEGPNLQASAKIAAWKSKVRLVFARALPTNIHLLEQFDAVRYTLGAWSSSTPESAWSAAFLSGVAEVNGLIGAAIYELETLTDADDVVEGAYHAELWAHVRQHVADGEWFKVASQAAIFVEHHIREWCGEPKGKSGELLDGKALFAHVLADDSEHRLGARRGEWEGWRFLGMGFAQALRNVDLHRIQSRADAKRYAMGVVGLGSLLLTQMEYERGEILHRDA